MTKKLAFTATTGLVGAAAFLTLGIALAGPDALHASRLLGVSHSTCGAAGGARQEMTLPFAATDRFAIHLPARVHYQPGGAAEAVISGDPALLAHVRLEQGQLRLNCDPGWFAPRLEVTLSGPPIAIWDVRGSGVLTLANIDQPSLRLGIDGSGSVDVTGAADQVEISISGSGETALRDLTAKTVEVEIRGSGNVSANGTADAVDVKISGSGDAELRDLIARSVTVSIRGSGDATLTAKVEADVFVSGSGDVEVSGGPVMRRSEVKGSGSIRRVP